MYDWYLGTIIMVTELMFYRHKHFPEKKKTNSRLLGVLVYSVKLLLRENVIISEFMSHIQKTVDMDCYLITLPPPLSIYIYIHRVIKFFLHLMPRSFL